VSILQYCLPHHAISIFAGWLANSTIPWLKNALIRYFLWRYTVNMEDAEQPDPFQYASYNAFFTRTLKAGARPLAEGVHDVISPVDGYVGAFGPIHNAKLIQAKGQTFTVDELLGVPRNPAGFPNDHGHMQDQQSVLEQAARFKQGSFITLYLAPHNYHRVHMPFEGHLSQMIYIPGRLFSVDFKTCATVPRLFARNERVVALFETALGQMAVIFVGAMIVGSIETVWAGTVGRSPVSEGPHYWSHGSGVYFERGEELGLFRLGSTVILLFEHQTLAFEAILGPSHPLCMGQKIATVKPL
jgi:phosphatidylserine decarboxylase